MEAALGGTELSCFCSTAVESACGRGTIVDAPRYLPKHQALLALAASLLDIEHGRRRASAAGGAGRARETPPDSGGQGGLQVAGVCQSVEQVTCLKLLATPSYRAFSVREGKNPRCCNGLWPSKATGHKQVYGVSLLLKFHGGDD